jgi:hypothetical protein
MTGEQAVKRKIKPNETPLRLPIKLFHYQYDTPLKKLNLETYRVHTSVGVPLGYGRHTSDVMLAIAPQLIRPASRCVGHSLPVSKVQDYCVRAVFAGEPHGYARYQICPTALRDLEGEIAGKASAARHGINRYFTDFSDGPVRASLARCNQHRHPRWRDPAPLG